MIGPLVNPFRLTGKASGTPASSSPEGLSAFGGQGVERGTPGAVDDSEASELAAYREVLAIARRRARNRARREAVWLLVASLALAATAAIALRQTMEADARRDRVDPPGPVVASSETGTTADRPRPETPEAASPRQTAIEPSMREEEEAAEEPAQTAAVSESAEPEPTDAASEAPGTPGRETRDPETQSPPPSESEEPATHDDDAFQHDDESAEPAGSASVPVNRPPPPMPQPGTGNVTPDVAEDVRPTSPSHVLVQDERGRVRVARVQAKGDRGLLVLASDGSMGWVSEPVPTDRPFRPQSAQSLREALTEGPYRGFRVVERSPYLVITEGSLRFAEAAADLLQDLYRDLRDCCDEAGLETKAPSFPLVAVIYRDERRFRSVGPADRDVQALYDPYSNRIVLFERSDQDRRAPELVTIWRRQSIAHEGVHQVLQNVGVQPRFAGWPNWLVEGLAEYFAPSAPRIASEAPHLGGLRFEHNEFGRENFGRVNPFHMATLIDLEEPAALLRHLGAEGNTRLLQRRGRQGRPLPWISALVAKSSLEPTDYALAWALTHYLAHREPERLVAYLEHLGRLAPHQPITPQEHLKSFQAAFGVDFDRLARRVDAHLADLRYEPVPYFAVRFEQIDGQGGWNRKAIVTQSPTFIAHSIRSLADANAHAFLWWAEPYPSRNRAQSAAWAWLKVP